jgi:predicted RNase H-like HicB family nuclease
MLDTLIPVSVSVRFIRDDDGMYYTDNSVLPDVIGFGETREDALASFIEGVLSFAYEYYDNFSFYRAAPNRASQAALVIRIISCYEQYGNIDVLIQAS